MTCLARPHRRRELPEYSHVSWIKGHLGDPAARQELVWDADCVLHIAGLTKASSQSAFHRTNVRDTAALVTAARQASVRHLIFVSSLAASKPDISGYAASKMLAEEAVRMHAGAMRVTIIRPPAVLGPGDQATRDVFQLLERGWMVYPASRRSFSFSWIDVRDLARFLLGIIETPPDGRQILSPCSGMAVSWREVADCAETVLGKRIRRIPVPAALVHGIGFAADVAGQFRAEPFIFSRGKARELLYPDWRSDRVVQSPTTLRQTIASSLDGLRRQD